MMHFSSSSSSPSSSSVQGSEAEEKMEMERLQKYLEAHSLVENMQKMITEPSESGKEVCPICLQEFMVGCEVRSTRCSHKYHEDCLLEWLKRSHYSCPLCRQSIPFTLEEFLGIVQSSGDHS